MSASHGYKFRGGDVPAIPVFGFFRWWFLWAARVFLVTPPIETHQTWTASRTVAGASPYPRGREHAPRVNRPAGRVSGAPSNHTRHRSGTPLSLQMAMEVSTSVGMTSRPDRHHLSPAPVQLYRRSASLRCCSHGVLRDTGPPEGPSLPHHHPASKQEKEIHGVLWHISDEAKHG